MRPGCCPAGAGHMFRYLVNESPAPGSDDTSGGRESTAPPWSQVQGSAQKGPMILGSSVSLAAMDDAANPTGAVDGTETTDDLGTFTVNVGYAGPVLLTAEGFHFDELQGALSTAPITLRAVASLTGDGEQSIHVSPVTHLTASRERALMAGGSALPDAVAQADGELVAALGIGPTDFDLGAADTELDLLGGDNDGNAYLFAVSAVCLQAAWDAAGDGGSGDATLQELLNNIANDLSDDGAIDPGYTTQLQAAQTRLDIDVVTANLQARLDELGSSAVVPDLRRVIDRDLDGIADLNDSDVDGDGVDGLDAGGDDCDDWDANVSPETPEICADGIDQNCSGWDTACPLIGTVKAADVASVMFGASGDNLYGIGGLGDISGDGLSEVWTQAYATNDVRVQVFAGAEGGPSAVPTATFQVGSWGGSVDGLGDIDGDGIGDVVVGSPADAGTAGAAYLLPGPLAGEVELSSAFATFTGHNVGDYVGQTVRGIGDADGDGLPDLLLGAYGNDHNGDLAGSAYLFTGELSGSLSSATTTFLGVDANDSFGVVLGGTGDFDGDGISDPLIGAYRADDGSKPEVGVVYVFTDGPSGSVAAADASARIVGAAQYDQTGGFLEYAGDLDGDGLDDIGVVPDTGYGGSVEMFYGGWTGDRSADDADFAFTSDPTANDSFGSEGFAAGHDLDGDGNLDIAVSDRAYYTTHGDLVQRFGRVYVFYGPFSGTRTWADADAAIEGDDPHFYLGRVAAVGDVSGDGAEDLLVGDLSQGMVLLGVEP